MAKNGALRVVDYKTGSMPREAFEAKALFQMKFYALVLWRTRGVVASQLKLLYLGDGDALTYAPEDELSASSAPCSRSWAAIEGPSPPATSGPTSHGSATGATTRPVPVVRRHSPPFPTEAAAAAGRRVIERD